MKRMTTLLLALLATICCAAASEYPDFAPEGTYKYAQKDSVGLFLDFYAPVPQALDNSMKKPTVLFAFGGGFITGSRRDKEYIQYYRALSEAGYPVVAIDYRLGMKHRKFTGQNLETFSNMFDSATMAAEDLFSATAWLLEHGAEIGADARNLVVCGSSAGAITVLQAAWTLDRRNALSPKAKRPPLVAAADASGLPEGFQYKAVMAFSGAVLFKDGTPRFSKQMCPVLLFHGTADKVVKYTKIQVFTMGMFGSCALDAQMTSDGVPHSFWRYAGKGHEIAGIMNRTLDKQFEFLQRAVIGGEDFSIDATVNDPDIKPFRLTKLEQLY